MSGSENGASLRSGRTPVIQTVRSAFAKGSCRKRTALTTLNNAVFAPIPNASVRTATARKAGRFINVRRLRRMSFQNWLTGLISFYGQWRGFRVASQFLPSRRGNSFELSPQANLAEVASFSQVVEGFS